MSEIKIGLLNKYVFTFDIVCKTGLHIGGGDSGAGIGEVENTVLKDPVTGYPYISGSSLKGRMRERLEWLLECVEQQADEKRAKANLRVKERLEKNGNFDPKEFEAMVKKEVRDEILKIGQCKCGKCDVCHYFGHSSDDLENPGVVLGPTRFIFRDAMPKESTLSLWEENLGRGVYTEIKYENTISRLTAIADPRQMERVPAGSVFSGEIIVDLYQTPEGAQPDNPSTAFTLLIQGMVAIEHSFLGGTGSRGSGNVEFNNLYVQKIPPSYLIKMEGTIEEFKFDPKDNASMNWQKKTFAKIN
jgi:CRISPR-associated protein Csm3